MLVATIGAAVASAPAASPASGAATIDVVGSGPIAWHNVAVRSRPSMTAPVLTKLTQFRKDFRPRYVMAVGERRSPSSGKAAWYRIVVPGRPNGRTGWVPAASAELRKVDRHLVIYRGARKFEFYVSGKLARTGKIAVGAKGMETPLGLFYVTSKFDPTWEVLGAYALETSAYSKLSEWPGGGVVGVHGTNTPWLLGQAVSHGCVRLHNRDINFLRSAAHVGTPVKIVA